MSAEQANPIVEPPSQNLEGVSVQLPAPRDVGEPNRPYPSAVTHAAPPAPPKDFRTRLLEALSDKNLRYYAGPGFSEFIDKLAALAPLLPGSGTVQSMQDSAHAGKDFEAGDYGPAAAHLGAGVANLGLDWLPLGKQLAILGGMAAKTFSWTKLKIAEAMEKAGKSVDEIWSATGLARGADNFWRFEISDRGYRVKPYVGVLDNEGFRVLIAGVLAQSLVLRAVPPSLDLVHAIPDLNHGALWRLSVKPVTFAPPAAAAPPTARILPPAALMSACALGAYSLA